MKFKISLLCFILNYLLFIGNIVRAQTSYHITTSQGLATNQLTILIKDHKNNMWFGSYNGLHKHEGTFVKVYKQSGKDSVSLSSKEMHAVFEDRKGFIWVGTTGGLDKLNTSTGIVQHYNLDLKNKAHVDIGYIVSIFQDDEENIWVSTDAGLFIVDYKTGVTKQIKENSNSVDAMPDVHLLYKGSVKTTTGIWMFASGYFIFYDFKTKQFFHQYNNPNHQAIFDLRKKSGASAQSELCIDQANNLYVVFNHSTLFKYNISTNQIDSFHFNFPLNAWKCCYSLAADYKGNIWIGFRYGGMLLFNHITKEFTPIRYNSENSLIQSDYVYSLCEDYQNRMWVTTNNGIFVINYYDSIIQQTYLSDKKEFINTNYESAGISQDTNGTIYIPYYNGGLFTYNMLNNDVRYFPIIDTSIKSYGYVYPAHDKKLLIAVKHSLYSADTLSKHLRLSKIKNQLLALLEKETGKVTWVFRLNDNNIYVKKTNGNMYYYDGSHTLEKIVGEGFSRQSCVSADSLNLFILNHDFCLLKRNLCTLKIDTISFKAQIDEQHFAFSNAKDIVDDGYGNIWMASQNGLVKFNLLHKTISVYTTSNGLLHDFTFALCVDSKKRLWIGSMGGVNVYDRKKDIFINVFTQSPDKLSNYFGSCLEAKNGHLYFLFGGQLININPDAFFRQENHERILQLDELNVNDKAIDLKSMMDLPYFQNKIYCRFGLLEFTEPEKVTYAYWLEGFDQSWIDLGNKPELNFNALPPGHYKLHIKANDVAGRSVKHQLLIPFDIHDPFWKTWWFNILITFLALLSIWKIIQWRDKNIRLVETGKIKMQQQQTTMLSIQAQLAEAQLAALRSQMNPHFIFNALNSIKKFVVANEALEAEKYLGKFSKLIRIILDNSQTEMVSIEREINLLGLYLDLEKLRFGEKLNYRILYDERINWSELKIPSMLIQPFVENAMLHGIMHLSIPGQLTLQMLLHKNSVEIQIEDNGVGRAKAELYKSKLSESHQSLAIQIISKRLHALKETHQTEGEIEIYDLTNENNEASGTKVIIQIPLN